MPKKASLFIGATIGVGGVFLAHCFSSNSTFGDLAMYLSFFVLALATSTCKVRLPGITGTISINFLFVLIATAVFTLAETVLMASFACVVQCLWKTKRRPQMVRVLFNVSVLSISSGVTYRLSHQVAGQRPDNLIVLLAVATVLFFTTNTLLVSGVLSLVEQKPLMHVWRQCYFWSLPYYLVGAIIAGMFVVSSRSIGWQMSLFVLPLMYMVFVFYRSCIQRTQHNMHAPAA